MTTQIEGHCRRSGCFEALTDYAVTDVGKRPAMETIANVSSDGTIAQRLWPRRPALVEIERSIMPASSVE